MRCTEEKVKRTMPGKLEGKKIAILCGDGVELLELTEPRKALDEAGAQTILISPEGGTIKAWDMVNWGPELKADVSLAEAATMAERGEFDALHLPGGPLNSDVLRENSFAVFFIKQFFFKQNKAVSVLCHAPWMLVEADVLKGRTVTSMPTIATDTRNAGAIWVNHAVVLDGNLITGRHPGDTHEFNPQMIDLFATWKQDQ
jgi:protease I